jgi:hypothetical protein
MKNINLELCKQCCVEKKYCSVNDRNRIIRRLFAKRKLTQTSHIVQYCWVLADLALLYGPKIGGPC